MKFQARECKGSQNIKLGSLEAASLREALTKATMIPAAARLQWKAEERMSGTELWLQDPSVPNHMYYVMPDRS